MALLVGRDDIGAFTGTSFFGFEGGNTNLTPSPTITAGTATLLNTAITNFNGNSIVRCVVYEQVGAVGDFTPVATIDVPSGSSPQSTTISPSLTITAGNEYHVVLWGDVASAPGGTFYQTAIDPTVVSPDGTAEVGVNFGTIPNPLPSLAYGADGFNFWNLDGTPASSENLGIRETFYTRGANTVVPDGNFEVTVLNPDLTNLIPTQTIASVTGVIEVDDRTLGSVGANVYMSIRSSGESDPDVAVTVVPSTVFDLDA